jgi:hypothetical protein
LAKSVLLKEIPHPYKQPGGQQRKQSRNYMTKSREQERKQSRNYMTKAGSKKRKLKVPIKENLSHN